MHFKFCILLPVIISWVDSQGNHSYNVNTITIVTTRYHLSLAALEVNSSVVVNTDTDSSVTLTCYFYGDNANIQNITWSDENGDIVQSGTVSSFGSVLF